MKKIITAILLFDLMAGLLFLGLREQGGFADIADVARMEGSSVTASGQGSQKGAGNGQNDRTGAENGRKGQTGTGNRQSEIDSQASGGSIQEENEAEDVKKIAITFDDGPHPSYTEQLLDGLKERGVHATFFVTGEHAQLHPEIIERMVQEGHLVGNHTYSHIQLTKNNREKFKEELIKTNEILKEITGEEVQYVRPPYGSWDKSFEKELNMFPVLWTVDPLDWCSRNVGCITEKIVKKAGENDIILMHDYYDTSVTAALKAIDELLEEGYTFVTVEEILFD